MVSTETKIWLIGVILFFLKKNNVKLRSLTFSNKKKCLYDIGIDDEIHSPFISVFVSKDFQLKYRYHKNTWTKYLS